MKLGGEGPSKIRRTSRTPATSVEIPLSWGEDAAVCRVVSKNIFNLVSDRALYSGYEVSVYFDKMTSTSCQAASTQFSSIITNMDFNSKKTSLIISGITALLCSRTFFLFINDPEGPNLLVVTVLAAILYSLSLAAVHSLGSSTTGLMRLLLTISTQIILVFGLYFFFG
jgi:hypothetical protein